MNPLRYLKETKLYKVTGTRNSDGSLAESFTLNGTYYSQAEEVTDSVSASLYGASIDKTLRISTPKNSLESFLEGKINPSSDNVSDYTIVIGTTRYRILRVKNHWIDIEAVGTFAQ